MKTVNPIQDIPRETQFSLAALFEYVTLCAILSALSTTLGLVASVSLMLMALALWASQGLLALAMLMTASLTADWSFQPTPSASPLSRQLAVVLLAAVICAWYRFRRNHIPAKCFEAVWDPLPAFLTARTESPRPHWPGDKFNSFGSQIEQQARTTKERP